MSTGRVLAVLATSFAVACGGPADGGSDAGGDGADAGEQQGTPDAGGNDGPPNAAANGTWAMAGVEVASCGFSLRGDFVGAAQAAPNTRGFTLTSPNKFNGFDVVLVCELAEGASTFTCADFVKGMQLSGCNLNGGFRNITGSIDGASGTVSGQAFTTGSGQNCTPVSNCGPNSISAVGTITPPAAP